MATIFRQRILLGPDATTPTESLSELYHENTKLHPLLSGGLEVPTAFTAVELHAMASAYKQYGLHDRIILPRIDLIPRSDVQFDDVIHKRRTVREFADVSIDTEELARILFQSYGVTGEARISGGEVLRLRAAPSAGALYPAEIYLGISRVEGIVPGIYHYNVLEHALVALIPGDPTERLFNVCCSQAYARQAAVVLLLSGVMQRTKRKYGERGYRYVLLDVGHLAQNICLAGTALGLAVTTTCGFYDDLANSMLQLDGVDETVLYVVFVGKASPAVAPIPTATSVRDGSL